MITIRQERIVRDEVTLTDEEAKQVVLKYTIHLVGGEGCYITDDGRVEHWTSHPHGSGTTTDLGEASPLLRAAWEFNRLLRGVK